MKTAKPFAITAALLTGSLLIATPQVWAATNPDAEKIMAERQKNFEAIGESFKTVRDQLRGSADMAKIQASANTIATLAPQLHTWFPDGTGPETGVETEAKSAIWADRATFNAAAEKLVAESRVFADVAATGDAAKIGAGVRGLGGACKNCHDQFREEQE